MKRSKGYDLTWFYLLVILLAALMWAKELMAADRVYRFWYYEIRGNSRICYYQGPNAPVLVLEVTQSCPRSL